MTNNVLDTIGSSKGNALMPEKVKEFDSKEVNKVLTIERS